MVGNVLVFEVQQNNDVTFRLYDGLIDLGRLGVNMAQAAVSAATAPIEIRSRPASFSRSIGVVASTTGITGPAALPEVATDVGAAPEAAATASRNCQK